MTTTEHPQLEPKTELGRMTAAQFHRIRRPARARLELEEGELLVSPSPMPRHSHAVAQLLVILSGYVKVEGLGRVLVELDTELGEEDVRCPDLLFVPTRCVQAINPDSAFTHGQAELVIEVISPGSRHRDRKDKFEQYAAAGINHYWIVDPHEKTAESYQLEGKAYVLKAGAKADGVFAAPPFPGLVIPLKELWWD